MDFQNSEPGICGCEPSLDPAAEGVVEAAPIVQALMAADRVDPRGVEELLRRMTAQLASQPDRWRFS
jgi:hypothetical protein